MRALNICFLCLLLLLPQGGWALSCLKSHGQRAIEQYPIILEGIARGSEAGKVNFEVNKVYKGNISDGDLISLSQKSSAISKARKYKNGNAYILFLNYNENLKLYTSSACSPGFSLESINNSPSNYWAQIETLAQLELLDASSDAEKISILASLTKRFPYVALFAENQAKLLASVGRYKESLEAYKNAFRGKFIVLANGRNLPPEDLAREYEDNYFATDIGIADHPLLHRNSYEMLIPYGKVLFNSGRYKEAAKIFQISKEISPTDEAEKLYLEALEKSQE